MDPQACFDEFIKNIGPYGFDEFSAIENAENLLSWLRHGGFPPSVSAMQLETMLTWMIEYMNRIS